MTNNQEAFIVTQGHNTNVYISSSDVPNDLLKCLKRAYEVAKEFATEYSLREKDKRGGLLILVGTEKDMKKTVANFDGEILKKYPKNNLLFSKHALILFREMGEIKYDGSENDGAIAFDCNGNLLGTEVFVNNVHEEALGKDLMTEIKRIRRKNGAMTRHYAGAFASLKNVSSVILSGESGSIITLIDGKIVEEFCYIPKKFNKNQITLKSFLLKNEIEATNAVL